MNLSILCRLLGTILAMVAVAMGICFVLAAIEAGVGQSEVAARAMGTSCLITSLAALVLWLPVRAGKPEELLRKEAIATVALGWILAALFGSLPYVFADPGLSWSQAFFESASGFTTTGSTILTGLDEMPDSLLLWRSLTQWIGGLGILALIVALLSTFGVSGKSLLGAESSMNLGQAPTARIKVLTYRLWFIYAGLTVVCWLTLWSVMAGLPVEANGFDAFLYSLTTVSTGGFAPHDASVAYFDSPAVELVLCLFMFVSSLNMILLLNLLNRNWKAKAGRTEAVAFLTVIAVVWATIILDLWLNHKSEGMAAVREALFPVISLSSSTGFGTVDYDGWPLFARLGLLILMAIGGCSGSTAGGIKIRRLIVFVRIVKLEIVKTFRPKLVTSVTLDGQKVDAEFQNQVLAYLALIASIVLVSTGMISLFEPGIESLDTAFGAAFATFFNMGPGFGALGPTENFSQLHDVTLLFFSLLMLMGRLEVFVILALFSRSLWTRY